MQAAPRARSRVRHIAPLAALLLGCASLAGTAFAADTKPATVAPKAFTLAPLSAADVQAYTTAFKLTRDGRFDAAQDAVAKADPLLKGRLAFAKLMHADYRASYDELAGWLKDYRDQPEAQRIYALAKKRQPAGAPAPPAPVVSASADWARVEAQAERIEARIAPPAKPTVDAGQQAAREAFYGGDVKGAHKLAVASNEGWIAGLSAFQLKRFDEARTRFAALAEDSGDEWVRSGAAYWAARAAIAAGDPEAAPAYLMAAARTPYTFYGLIAERQLGLEPAVGPDGIDHDAVARRSEPLPARARTVSGADGQALAALVRADKRAARAAAFVQAGLRTEAGQELRTALQGSDGEARRLWTQLGLALNVPVTSPRDLAPTRRARFDIAQFPTPDLSPKGGFTLDRALVYALVRQESRFNPEARSASGAHGLMQLMPATAARVAGDDKLTKDPSPLSDPAINLRLGQDYVARLLEVTKGDLLHTVAAYNAGPGVIMKTLSRLGGDGDSLMAIESMPGAQTREFVEKVVAGYWIYRNIFGQDSRTLDAAASGAKSVLASLDLPGPRDRAEAKVLSTFFAVR